MPDDYTDFEKFEDWDPTYRHVDRDRGILTRDDRKYLSGDRELEGQQERNTRYRIRQRVKQALLDLAFLAKYTMSSADLDQLGTDEDINQAWTKIIGGLYVIYMFGKSETNESLINRFEDDLEQMLLLHHPWKEGHSTGRSVDVDIEVNQKGKTVDEIKEALIDGNATVQEASFYARFGDNDMILNIAENILEEYQKEIEE